MKRLLAIFALLCLCVPVYAAEKPDILEVITIDGVIDDGMAAKVTTLVQQINENKRAKAVMLEVDSPGGGVLASAVSTFYLFQNLKKELTAWAHYANEDWPRCHRDALAMRLRLSDLLKGQWSRRYTKAKDKQPRGKPKPKKRLHGDHTSVLRLLKGTAKVMS